MIDRVDNVLYPNLFHLFSPSASFSGVVLKQGHKIKGDFKGNCRIVLACQMYCKKGHNFESKNRLTSYWTIYPFVFQWHNVLLKLSEEVKIQHLMSVAGRIMTSCGLRLGRGPRIWDPCPRGMVETLPFVELWLDNRVHLHLDWWFTTSLIVVKDGTKTSPLPVHKLQLNAQKANL